MSAPDFWAAVDEAKAKLAQAQVRPTMEVFLTAKAEEAISEREAFQKAGWLALVCPTSWRDVPARLICFPDDPERRREVKVMQKSWLEGNSFALVDLDPV